MSGLFVMMMMNTTTITITLFRHLNNKYIKKKKKEFQLYD